MVTRPAAFNPASFSDVPLYNIQAVAASTGMPAITLRSWERRYGVPCPKRDPKGYRMYSERDIAVTRWLRERVQHGIGISHAVHILRALERGEIEEQSASLDLDSVRVRLLQAVMRLDPACVYRALTETLAVSTVEDAVLGVIQPVLYEVGERWAQGRLSVTTEHVGTELIRSQLSRLVHVCPEPLRAERVVVTCAPGERHDLGALAVALFLRRRGFDVVFVGANPEPDSLLRDIERLQPQAVCISASISVTGDTALVLCERLRSAYGGIVGVGGQVFAEDPGPVDGCGACVLGLDAREAVTALEARLMS